MPAAGTVHVIFKTHLDIGFTDLAADVLRRYRERFIPRAMAVARELRLSGRPERFVWTTGSWLVWDFLEQADRRARRRMEEAILAGDLVWHALPFTTHSELMDPHLFRTGLGLSRELDRRFGRRTVAAKMTDVPGHTRGIVPLLAEAGVAFLHIGVNPVCKPPAVPPVFRWRHTDGSEVAVMYHTDYGVAMKLPFRADAIFFAHTGDNQGPQDAAHILAEFDKARTAFPGASAQASTLDAVAAQLAGVRARLPVIEEEIGDSWIHGGATDPRKVARYRAVARVLRREADAGRGNAATLACARRLILVPEHTWGVDLKTHLKDWEHWSAAQLARVRRRPNFRLAEASWAEQDAYIDEAVAKLGRDPLARTVRAELAACRRRLSPATGFRPFRERIKTAHFTIGFSKRTGAIDVLERAGKRWADESHQLARFSYQTCTAGDFHDYVRRYTRDLERHFWWAMRDLTRWELRESETRAARLGPDTVRLLHRREPGAHRFQVRMTLPVADVPGYGCPREVVMEVRCPDASPEIEITLSWRGKRATRLPEVSWLSFAPAVADAKGWRLHKLGCEIDPLAVVLNGNRFAHAVQDGFAYRGPDGALAVDTLDAPLVALGEPRLLVFDDRQPDLAGGVHVCLHNNLWNSNFRQWYAGASGYRFIVRPA